MDPSDAANPLQRPSSAEPTAEARAKITRFRQIAHEGARDPVVVKLADWLVAPYPPDDWLSMAQSIHRFVRDKIRYQHDPDLHDDFRSVRSTLERSAEDCDGKVTAAVALMLAAGLDAEVVPVLDDAGRLKHVQGRVRWPGSRSIRGSVGGWIFFESTIRGAELGQRPTDVASNPETGRLPLSGGPPPSSERGLLE